MIDIETKRDRGPRGSALVVCAAVLCWIALGPVHDIIAQEDAAQASSLIERWRETLLYGIDSEVSPILEQIEQSGVTELDELIVERFGATRSDDLRTAIVEHFTERESNALADAAEALLLSDTNTLLDGDLLRASAEYLSRTADRSSPELLARYADIAEDGDLLAATVAIDAIGRDGGPDAVALLLDLYEHLQTTDLRAAVIRALGETGSPDALPLLTTLAADEFQESSLRQYAAESLGKIGAEESLPLLTELLSADDSLVRAYATYALGFYETDEARARLEEALRDSFWRVRVAALQGLAEQGGADALAAVAYKARRDPERPVREEAIKTLARISADDSIDVLRELAASPRVAQTERILAVEKLAEHDAAAHADTFAEIIAAEWERDGSRLLDAVGRMISEHPSTELEPLYLKLLSHRNFIVRIYGIRGIGGAGVSSRADALKEIARENPPGLLRRTALSALSEMGIDYDPEDAPQEPTETTATPETTDTPGESREAEAPTEESDVGQESEAAPTAADDDASETPADW
jgi:HEAT repeat protein